MIDPMVLVQESRPHAAEAASSFVPQAGAMRRRRDTVIEDSRGNARSASELSAMPGTTNYRAGIGNPPCGRCAQDHNPIKAAQGGYDHDYIHPDNLPDQGLQVLSPGPVEIASAVATVTSPSVVSAGVLPPKRMTLFPGKHDQTYLLVVEERQGDDWEDVAQFVLAENVLARTIPIFDVMGLKIKDRTGGDLVMLRNPNDGR